MRLVDIDSLKGCAIIRPTSSEEVAHIEACKGWIAHKDIPTAYDVEAVVAGIIAIHNQTCTEEIDCKGWNCNECFEMRVRECVRNGGRE